MDHILDYSMPLLQHLELILGHDALGNVFLCDVPLLRTVVFNSIAASRVIVPWAQLTSLTLLSVYPSDCVPILLQAQNLVHCDLDLFVDIFSGQPRPDIALPYLESLVITFANYTERSVTNFLPTFIIPALRNLTVSEGFLSPDPIDSLRALISKSGCRLEELRIRGERLLPKKSYRKAFPLLCKLVLGREIAGDEEDSEDSASSN
ncbi:hypothetical protein DFH06DRAFT_1225425 [Mycena polygramma]|nr:hypothetical protein DFH06DRAFT_1225425 [Mycena polygramma]